jgi:hypothetical protein
MTANRGVEQHNQLDKMQAGGGSANELDVIELFKQDRERKAQTVQEHGDEAVSGAATKRRSVSSVQYDERRKSDPQLRAIEHFAKLAGRALPELSEARRHGTEAATGLESLLNRVSNMNQVLPAVDLIQKRQHRPS